MNEQSVIQHDERSAAVATTGTNPLAFIERAVELKADPAHIRELMELRREWEADEARKAFFGAMAQFQADCPDIPKDGEVYDKHGGLLYRFAKLETVIKTIKAIEQANGFRHRWDQEDLETGGVRVTCEVSHVAGHSERSSVTIPPAKGMNTNAAQDRGIIIKYGKRYSLLSAYGLEPDEDTDANTPPALINDEQVKHLERLVQETNSDRDKFLAVFDINDMFEMTDDRYDQAVKMLEAKRRKQARESQQ